VADLPEDFIHAMRVRLGTEAERFFQTLTESSPVSIRLNPLKPCMCPGNPVTWCPSGRYLNERPSFTLDPVFHAGGYYVQEASSMLLEQVIQHTVDTAQPQLALDLCGAPGGKSTHLVSLLSRDSLVISNEVIRSRASILAENMTKWGYENVIVTCNDPQHFSRMPDFADLVIIDAPCSGEGLFRKDPEALKEWSTQSVALCSSRQRRIIADAWAVLKPGGVLVYSTCTYNESENIGNLQWINDHYHPEFLPIQLNPDWGIETIQNMECIGYQCFPHHVKGEGFFFSAMRKPGNRAGGNIRVRKQLSLVNHKIVDSIKPWLLDPDGLLFFLHGQQIRFIPKAHEKSLIAVLDNLHVVQAGTGIGEVMKNKVVPDHAMALSVRRNQDHLPGIPITRDQAITYLRKDALTLGLSNTGYHVIEYEGLGLGWANILPNRINNLYPSAWRIRKSG